MHPVASRLDFEVVDVFTDRPFAGNQLSVVLGADALSAAQMQVLAKEFGFSETAFVVAPPEGADYAVRIFTPATELPFAGHPSVGSAWVLGRRGDVPLGEAVQACGAGLLPVSIEERGAVITAGQPSTGGPIDAAAALRAVGLAEDDLAGAAVRRCGAGIDFTYLLVRPDAVARAVPDLLAVAALGGAGLSVTSWAEGAAHSRVFAAGAGVGEDAATGSAAAGLGVFLAASGLVEDGTTDYVVSQGAEIGRPSTMRCTVEVRGGDVVRATVGGGVQPVATGSIAVP